MKSCWIDAKNNRLHLKDVILCKSRLKGTSTHDMERMSHDNNGNYDKAYQVILGGQEALHLFTELQKKNDRF